MQDLVQDALDNAEAEKRDMDVSMDDDEFGDPGLSSSVPAAPVTIRSTGCTTSASTAPTPSRSTRTNSTSR